MPTMTWISLEEPKKIIHIFPKIRGFRYWEAFILYQDLKSFIGWWFQHTWKISYHNISKQFITVHIITVHIISDHVMSYHITSCNVISKHIISHHIILYSPICGPHLRNGRYRGSVDSHTNPDLLVTFNSLKSFNLRSDRCNDDPNHQTIGNHRGIK